MNAILGQVLQKFIYLLILVLSSFSLWVFLNKFFSIKLLPASFLPRDKTIPIIYIYINMNKSWLWNYLNTMWFGARNFTNFGEI